jgi:hypothetical protein
MDIQKKKFAQDQFNFLKQHGITNRLRLSRIFKAAGPGQVQEAWKLANCIDWNTPEGKEKFDLLDVILKGCGGSQRFGKERMAKILESLGFYVPQTHTEACFFRALRGAHEILVPGSFRFSHEEMEEISEGLRKRMDSSDDV